MLIRRPAIWHLAHALIVAAAAGELCLAQPSDDTPISSSPGPSYPWPAPVDSRSPLWEGYDAPDSGAAEDPFAPSGQLEQRALAEREANRGTINDSSARPSGHENDNWPRSSTSSSRRWAWPSPWNSNWFSLSERSKSDPTPSDPFARRQVSNEAQPRARSDQLGGSGSRFRRLPNPDDQIPRMAMRSNSSSDPRGVDLFEAARIIAMVGDQPILAGDLAGQVNEIVRPYVGQASEEELEKLRERLMRQLLPQLIDVKLLCLDFQRVVPKDRLEDIKHQVSQHFDQTQLPEMVTKAQVSSPRELDAKLREVGSSLEQQRRLFIEQVFAGQAKNRNAGSDEPVTHEEMLSYYREHANDYEYPAKARWERLTVYFKNFASKDEARRAIAYMGNQVLYGASLASVARRYSQGPKAREGGYHDWTTQGSLVSHVLDRAIFTLEVGYLSPILEDENGLHIIRVIERREAGRVSFLEAQTEIKDKILHERRRTREEQYLERLRRQTRIWTLFDGLPEDAGPSRIARQSGATDRSPW